MTERDINKLSVFHKKLPKEDRENFLARTKNKDLHTITNFKDMETSLVQKKMEMALSYSSQTIRRHDQGRP